MPRALAGESGILIRISEAMIVALDAEGRVTLLNRRGCEILGYRKEEIIGKNWFEMVVPVDIRAELLVQHQATLSSVSSTIEHDEYSIGTAIYSIDATTTETPLVRADDAMYADKRRHNAQNSNM